MLTYIQINAAKPRAKAYSLPDSQGLHLFIQPNGSKLWRFKYRFLDKQKMLHLGGWPQVTLGQTRALELRVIVIAMTLDGLCKSRDRGRV